MLISLSNCQQGKPEQLLGKSVLVVGSIACYLSQPEVQRGKRKHVEH